MYAFPEGHGFDGHEPDYIDTRPDLYKDYGLGLYDILLKKVAATPRLAPEALGDKLLEIAKLRVNAKNEAEAEFTQIARIREVALADLKQGLAAYAPERDTPRTTTWADFQTKHPTMSASSSMRGGF